MKYLLILSLFIFSLTGCYYDRIEDIPHPDIICDTLPATYTASIVPILTTNCLGCHSGSNASGGIRLDLYGPLRAQIVSGVLLPSIKHTPGADFMPKNGGMLNKCDIDKFTRWIAAGYLQN
jgi:hypothetical protein